MDEHSFVKGVHEQLKKRSPGIYKWKINARFVRGVPDAWYSGPAGDLWVEYKWLSRTPKRKFTPGLSAHQLKWLRERHAEGRAVAVIVGCPAGAVVLLEGEWDSKVAVPSEQWLTTRGIAAWITEQTLSTST